MARAHAHSSAVMWDALSSRPPLRRVELGLLRVRVSAPSAPSTRLYSSGIASIYGVLHRVGAVAELPGPIGCYLHTSRDANWRKLVKSWTSSRHPHAGAVCCGARACTCMARRVLYVQV
jgi:hypothetical protein